MKTKQQFIDWLRQSENPDDTVLAALLEQGIIEMPVEKEQVERDE
jgi:hypothetical protein